MRIDYSEPKRSVSSPQAGQPRPRSKEPSGGGGGTIALVAVTALVSLGIGFGSGWLVSQRAAKKEFKAKMEQQSLETSAKQTAPPPIHPQPAAAATPAASPQSGTQSAAATAQPGVQPGTQAQAADQPLSFYKTLPSGQKSTVLGSGINNKTEKAAKQPLQAALPANLAKPADTAGDEPPPKTQAQGAAQAKPSAVRPDASGFTVQVASYSLKSEAETLRSTLAAKGYNVSIIESHLGDKGTWYRVRVGKKLDPDAAKDLAKKLGKGALAIPDKE
jgi:cell division septation protein DedD